MRWIRERGKRRDMGERRIEGGKKRVAEDRRYLLGPPSKQGVMPLTRRPQKSHSPHSCWRQGMGFSYKQLVSHLENSVDS